MHAVDDRAGAQEEQRLEEGVGDHVEQGGHVGAGADGQERVAQLADRRVRQHLLDVVLGDGDGGDQQGGAHADPGDDVGQPVAGRGQHRVHPDHQEDPGGDHGGRVDQGRDRRRAGHCVGQPDEQRELGRLAHRTHEQQGGDRRGRRGGHGRGTVVELEVVQRADGGEGEEHGDEEAPVADPVGDEGLLARHRVGHLGEPEGDELVRAEAHALPARGR